MLNTVIFLFSEVLLVADERQEQRDKTVLPHLVLGKKEKLGSASLGIAYLEAKEKHYIYTRHNHTMKRLLNHKIMFQPQRKELSHL